jgi:predicted ATPase
MLKRIYINPMLKRVHIQNFKSLKDVTLDLQQVNLLIGPNNSGKTNFLKALESYSPGSFEGYLIKRFQDISFKHQPVDILFEFSFLPGTNWAGNFGRSGGQNKIYNNHLKAKIDFKSIVPFVDRDLRDFFTNKNGETLEIIVQSGDREEFYDYLKVSAFKPDPSKIIQKSEFSADEVVLKFDCSNLISMYYYTDSNFKKNAHMIQQDLSNCIPEISYFTLPPVKDGEKSMLGLRFFDKDDNGYWADEVSEGVLYFLALLCIIHQPNPPKLLLLEEPEKGIHPRRIKEVIEFIRQLAAEKDVQVIMTTHSPLVLNEFNDSPECVFIFDKDEEGATHVKNLQRDVIEPDLELSRQNGVEPPNYTDSLGDSWTIGFLGGVPK